MSNRGRGSLASVLRTARENGFRVPATFAKPKQNALDEKMLTLFEQGVTGSVTIQVESEKFTVDKVFLMAHSEVFESMLTSGMEEEKTGVIKIDDVSPKIMSVFIKYVYSRNVKDLGSMAEELYLVADKYLVEGLKNMCTENLIATLCKSNIMQRLVLAVGHNIEKLKDAIVTYMTKDTTDVDFPSILLSDEWRELSFANKDASNAIMKTVFDKTKLVRKSRQAPVVYEATWGDDDGIGWH